MKPRIPRRTLLAFAAIALTVVSAHSGTVTVSATPPAVDGEDIAQFVNSYGGSTFDVGKWFAGTGDGGDPGQTFTPDTDVTLHAFTLQSRTSITNAGFTFTLRVGTVSGSTLTVIHSETVTMTGPAAAESFLTFPFDAPVGLQAGTLYGVDVIFESETVGWPGNIPYLRFEKNDVYAGGAYYKVDNGGGTEISLNNGWDRTFHLDLQSAAPSTFPLVIMPNSPDSLFKLEWPSQAGMLYRVLNNTGLGTPIDTWSIVDEDIAATPDTNTYNVNPGNPRLFYAVEEYPAPPPPPLLEESFDVAAALPTGWTSNGPSNGTDWEVGTPSGVASGPGAANSAPNCAGTNIGGYYTENADVSLVSPSIAIPSGSGASLSLRQFIDTDLAGTPHDLGSVRILDADNADAPIAGLEILDIEGDGLAGWTEEMLDLPALDVGGKNIKVEFRFVSNAGAVPDLDVWGGFYVDDVAVTVTGP